ncbi:MAG: UDP-N-acetylmuramoyl-tripeptide--D-alanyl-D-alanine ligase [Pseudomonadales bacterium]|nr:UDP-N-acetylmuramoyl-tripeptide--D-alanyl-D-alanine ligase [Pseudomonadales bacterium]
MVRSFALTEISAFTGGVHHGRDVAVNSVSIDTRTLERGDLFIAIRGPNFNGEDFIEKAVEKGAVAAMVNSDVVSSIPVIRVNDTRRALGQFGKMNREFALARMIGITGSQGKTTVKEMVAAILKNCGDVLFTKGNLNNELGVPLTLLKIEKRHKYAVIEMGANKKGDIAYTSSMVKPHIAHITNVAGTHLEGFGSLDAVARAKGEIWKGLDSAGLAIINSDDNYAESWKREAGDKKIITISARGKTDADYYVSDAGSRHDGVRNFTLHNPAGRAGIQISLLGEHNVANALAAAAISIEAGADIEAVKKGLREFRPVNGRLCLKKGMNDSLLVDDSYNASPSSFRAAIDVLVEFQGEKILVAGDMGELGPQAVAEHCALGSYALNKGVDRLFATGSLSEYTARQFGNKAVHCADRDALAEKIRPYLMSGVTVLIKGSRSAGMDKLVQQLTVTGDK